MSLPVSIAALGAAGILSAVTRPNVKQEFHSRIDALRSTRVGAESEQRAVETDRAVRTCDRFSQCSFDRAISNSYGRCRGATSSEVKAVCFATTLVIDKVGNGGAFVVRKIRSLF